MHTHTPGLANKNHVNTHIHVDINRDDHAKASIESSSPEHNGCEGQQGMQMRPEVSVGKMERGSLGLGDPAGRGPASGGPFVSSLRLKIPNVHLLLLLLLHPPLLYHLPCPPSPGQAAEKSRDIWFV